MGARARTWCFLVVLGLASMLFGESIRYTSYHTRRTHDLRGSLVPLEDSARPTPTANGESFSPPPPAAAATEAATTEAIATAATVPCCSLRGDVPLNFSLEWPVKMPRPIRVLMKHGNFDGPWPCDVPCEYMTLEPPDADVDVVVGEAAPPIVSAKIRRANPLVATAARSMESAIYYPSLRRLPEQVDASMTTDLQTSQVPVVYLTRSSIAKWNSVPVQWNASALLARFGGSAEGQPSAVFVARNCHSKNGREDLIKRLAARLRGGVDRPGSCLNSIHWPRCAASAAAAAAAEHGKCGKHAVMRRYPFYLAFENSDDVDYVSEKVFHGLEAGVLPVYLGAPNVAEFVPPSSVVEVRQFGHDVEKLARHLQGLLDEPERYLSYFAWKRRGNLPVAFQRKFGFVATHAKCRLCRWAWARKHKFAWDRRAQRPVPLEESRSIMT